MCILCKFLGALSGDAGPGAGGSCAARLSRAVDVDFAIHRRKYNAQICIQLGAPGARRTGVSVLTLSHMFTYS